MERRIQTAWRTMIVAVFALWGTSAMADQIIILDTWNVDDIQNSGDTVTVTIDDFDDHVGGTTVTFQWQEGDTGDDLWTAIGLDTIFYNSDPYAGVVAVLENGIDVTADWNLNFGGSTGGGGFGNFISLKNLDGGGTGGIDPNTITLVFNTIVNFVDNGDPNYSTFDVHVRYGNDCSGWVSDGNTTSDTGEPGGCGPTRVPEPGTLGIFGLGLLGIALTRRFRFMS